MNFELVEPVRILFKDEVRVVGDELGLPHDMVYRQPFPGPGLGIRIIGDITPEKVRVLQEADDIYMSYYICNGMYCVNMPVESGDSVVPVYGCYTAH